MTEPPPVATSPPVARLPALDWLRGLVMLVMAVDHCDSVFNPHHAMGDSAMLGVMGMQGRLSPPDFLTRWCTHLCAPTFVFLSGAGMAISAANAARRGGGGWRFDRYLLMRGLVLVALELTIIRAAWTFMEHGGMQLPDFILQVIYAIGFGMVLMVPLRRLPAVGLVVAALLLLGGSELVADLQVSPTSLLGRLHRLAFAPGILPTGKGGSIVLVLYPALTWLPAMMLGWAFGRSLSTANAPVRRLLCWGLASLAVFALLRYFDDYGNMGLHRRDDSAIQWLHCSKYPPSITYLTMELGIMALLLAFLFALQRWVRATSWSPLFVVGQVPLFFYILHPFVIGCWDRLGVFARGSPWWMSWIAAGCTVLALWPLCYVYRWYKQTWQHAWTRYL